MNRNLAVSFSCYAECVQMQVEFLVSEGFMQVRSVDHADVQECYDRSVSVDACAKSLVM